MAMEVLSLGETVEGGGRAGRASKEDEKEGVLEDASRRADQHGQPGTHVKSPKLR